MRRAPRLVLALSSSRSSAPVKVAAMAFAFSFASTPWSLQAQETPDEAEAQVLPGAAEGLIFRGPTDPIELEAYLDGLMEVALDANRTAGGVVAVVSGGEVMLAKGYGYADWEARAPVDPETTLFRIGSVSKLFVWTSVMQMVEQGLLDLYTDVNEYLDFEIPATYPEPVTLNHIMAHAAGFEDYVLGLFGDEPEDVRPLGDILKEQIPARVRPAGDVSSYSNHATAMAAYMVERVSGVEWKEYVDRNILEPLGMEHTTFVQPIPEDLADDLSKAYGWGGGRFREEDFEYVPLAPVGAAAASAGDMARFMIAHLHLGRYRDGRILSEETARLMQTEHFRAAPQANGMAHGFAVMSQRGEHIIGHGGDTQLFHTGLWLFPELDLGIFMSFNSQLGGGARTDVFEGLMERYFPEAYTPPDPSDDFAEQAERLTGEFRSNRFSHTTVAKLSALGEVSVSVTDRGTLRALGTEWIQAEPLVFAEEDGPREIVFREDTEGDITHFFVSTAPYAGFERIPAAEKPLLNIVLFVLAIACVVGSFLAPFLGWGIRKWFRVSTDDLVRLPGRARISLWLAAALYGLGALMVFVAASTANAAVDLPNPILGFALLLLVIAVLPTLASVLFAVRAWMKGEGRFTVRLLYTMAAVSFCLLIWQLNTWNLLGWKYG
jgi:CubicO group peptidase (beta-lactamase class C family)